MSIVANKQEKTYNELCLSEITTQDINNDPPLDDSIHSRASTHDSFYQLSLGSPVQKYDDTLTTIDVVKIGRRDRPTSALTIPNVDEINESVEEEAFSTDKPKDFTLKHSPVKKEEEDNTLNLSSIRCSFFKSIGDVQDEEGEPNEESKWVEFNEFEISTETTENSVYTSSEVGGTSTAFVPVIFATAEVKSTQTSTMIQSDDGPTKQTDNNSLVEQVDKLSIRLEALEQLVAASGIGGDNPTQVSSDSASEDLDMAFLNEDSADITVTETFTITNDIEENNDASSSNKKRGKVSAFKRMCRLFAK